MRKHNQLNPDQKNELYSVFGAVMLTAAMEKWNNLSILTALATESVKFIRLNPQHRYAVAEALDKYMLKHGLMFEATEPSELN